MVRILDKEFNVVEIDHLIFEIMPDDRSLVKPSVWTDVIDDIANGFIYGHRVDQYGVRGYSDWMILEKPMWITKSVRVRWDELGFESIPTKKLIEFEELTEEYFQNAVNYVYIAAGDNKDLKELAVNWILGPVAEIMNERKSKGPLSVVCPAADLNLFLTAMLDGKFNKSMGKDAFREFIKDRDLNALINNDKFKLADQNVIDSIIKSVYEANKDQFIKAKTDPKLVNWLVGQVMKGAAGKAKAPEVRDKVIELVNQ